MNCKRYRVTVEFAHGVRHVFESDKPTFVDALREWANNPDAGVVALRDEDEGRTYYLNRDYLCSMVVEELEATEG